MVHTCTIGKIKVHRGHAPLEWRLVAPDGVTATVRHSGQIVDMAHHMERLYDCRHEQAYGIRQRAVIRRRTA